LPVSATGHSTSAYIGHTDDISRRAAEHRHKVLGGFTAKHNVGILVWYEEFATREEAFVRERRMKKWNRIWKIELIERFNPGWRDLAADML
jgi:putative endonuclease